MGDAEVVLFIGQARRFWRSPFYAKVIVAVVGTVNFFQG